MYEHKEKFISHTNFLNSKYVNEEKKIQKCTTIDVYIITVRLHHHHYQKHHNHLIAHPYHLDQEHYNGVHF